MAMKLPLFLCFLVTFIFSCSSESTISENLTWWCGQTPYHQTCDHYLSNMTTYASISTTDFLGMTMQAAIDEAHVVRKRAHDIESKYPNAPGKGLWSSCVDYFDAIVFTFNSIFDHTLNPTPLDIQTWNSAGLAYIDMRVRGFELINMTNTILPVISKNLTELITNSLAISALNRGSDTPGFVDWNYQNEYKSYNLTSNQKPNVVVAQDGSGDFQTFQEAVNSASNRADPTERYVIYVKAGTYTENVLISDEVQYITMYGDGIDQTVITGSGHLGGDTIKTALTGDLKSTATFQVYGREFIAHDMTFQNTAGPYANQAIALLSGSDHSVFYHCSFEGYQDTLYAVANAQFYKECQIFGTVDFIFGAALAVFQDCKIFLRNHPISGLVVTAQSRQNLNDSSGFSLQGCNITATDDLTSGDNDAFLGRPWTAYALTVFMESYLDDLIDPLGWEDSWGNNETCYYGEYNNFGPGSSTDNRVNWPSIHKLTDQQSAQQFTVGKFLQGNDWLPSTGVPYISGFEK